MRTAKWRKYLCLVLTCSFLAAPFLTADAAALPFESTAEIAVFSIENENYLRTCGDSANLKQLGADEFLTYALTLRYTGSQSLTTDGMSVSIDGGERYRWAQITFEENQAYLFHVYYVNMRRLMTEGRHTVTWYLDNQVLLTKTFEFTAQEVQSNAVLYTLPDQSAIEQHNRTSTMRSPYLYGFLQMNDNTRFSQYAVDFMADELPRATYLCLANMRMDLSPLKKYYSNVHTEYSSTTMYAGFQRRWTDYVSILSFWDVYGTDANGVQHTIRAKRLYPEDTGNSDDFTGEGTGAHALVNYNWQSGRWYRMLLQCSQSPESGTTLVEQWVLDLETNQWTMLCKYDTGIPDSCFMSPVAFFLENFDPAYSGDVRTMNVRNARLFDLASGSWKNISSAMLGSNGGRPDYDGSYFYGSTEDAFIMLTSGVGGDWYAEKRIPQNQIVTITPTESGSPY